MSPLTCQVLVIGGGPAGIAAATAAGRAGARVVLLERYGFLGGLATAGQVGTVCGLYLRDETKAPPALVSAGFLPEFASQLAQRSQAAPLQLARGLWVLPFAPWAFERTAEALLTNAGDVTILVHFVVTIVAMEASRVRQVEGLAWNERVEVRPEVVVDCTGEATVTALAGGEVCDQPTAQVPALVFVMENVAADFNEHSMLNVLLAVRRAVEAGQLPAGCEWLSLVPGSANNRRVALKLNIPNADGEAPAWRQVSAGEREARERLDHLQRFLRDNVAAFAGAHLGQVAPQLGTRAGRRIVGHQTLTEADVLSGRKCDDGIARGAWPVERWLDPPKPTMAFLAARDYYEIPIGCLCPAGLDNVLAAGRCLSAEPAALASGRVIGTALATGWAAGWTAAALAEGKTIQDAVPVIRQQLNG